MSTITKGKFKTIEMTQKYQKKSPKQQISFTENVGK